MRRRPLPPNAAAMVEALRDIGYSLEGAVADIVDNSLTAQARTINLRYGWQQESPWLAIIDDGSGMSESELFEAMRVGSRNPRDPRTKQDLGRFGLGLKTASFSQSRCLTVASRKASNTSAKRWDLDEVDRNDDWTLLDLTEEDLSDLPAYGELGPQGTYVLWQQLDRLDLGPYSDSAHERLNDRVNAIRKHISLVFHRFMAPDPGYQRVRIFLNGLEVEPFEPFNASNPATDHLLAEKVRVEEDYVLIQPYVLPHHSKVSAEEYEKYAGDDGYLRSQGFYIYRNRRLIRHGTWFRLCRQEELTKLARVKIDIPNTLDHLWTIDVRKSRASPPEVVRQRMKQVVDRIRGSARRPYTHRGEAIRNRTADMVWQRRSFNDRIAYCVNSEHPLIQSLRVDLDESLRARLDVLLRMIESSLPIPLLFSDMGTAPNKIESAGPDIALLAELAHLLRNANPGLDHVALRRLFCRTEPFASWPNSIDEVLEKLSKDSADVA